MLLFILISCFTTVLCTDFPACPTVTPCDDFNITLLASGVWHEIARYPNPLESTTKCVSYATDAFDNGFKSVSLNTPENSPAFVTALGKTVADNNGKGVIIMKIYTNNPKKFIETPVMNYVYADHKDLLMVYGCDYDDQKKSLRELAWIFSRTRKLSNKTQAVMDDILKANNKAFDNNKLKWIDQTDC